MYLLENYGSAEKIARMNSASYEKLRSLSRGKFSPQQFLKLKVLAANTVGVNNSIFNVELRVPFSPLHNGSPEKIAFTFDELILLT